MYDIYGRVVSNSRNRSNHATGIYIIKNGVAVKNAHRHIGSIIFTIMDRDAEVTLSDYTGSAYRLPDKNLIDEV